MKEDLLKIINHYGINNQLKKLSEEVYELQEAILTTYKKDEEGVVHIDEEIADVLVLLFQFIAYYDIQPKTDIIKVMEYKINRQLKRIEEEK